MTNFSSFFPVAAGAGGGGGFTNMKKYVTARSKDDATNKLGVAVSGRVGAAIYGGGQTSFQWYSDNTNAAQQALVTVQDALVGYTFSIGYGTQTVTGNTGAGFGTNQTLSFTPAVGGEVAYNQNTDLTPPTYFTVNPATDLGLEDGASLGYFMIGSGTSKGDGSFGGFGGYIIQGTATIASASTNLTLTPAAAVVTSTRNTYTHSTITGGITLTTADGYNGNGWGSTGSTGFSAAGPGVNGYGVGATAYNRSSTNETQGSAAAQHGFGSGGHLGGSGGDGAILLFY